MHSHCGLELQYRNWREGGVGGLSVHSSHKIVNGVARTKVYVSLSPELIASTAPNILSQNHSQEVLKQLQSQWGAEQLSQRNQEVQLSDNMANSHAPNESD